MSNNSIHIIPDLSDWPLTKFSEDRDAFIQRLIDFVLDKIMDSPLELVDILNKTVYMELKRVKNRPWKIDPSDEKSFWRGISKEIDNTKIADNAELEQLKILRRIVHRYSEEIIGHFIPKTHLFARKFLSMFFKRLYNNGWARGHKGIWGSRKNLLEKIKVQGYTEETKKLFSQGTVVIVPTHYSNLDSIQIGFGIDQKVGIPAFAYGAGLNLFDYEIIAYFMNRLGAYRVDRRKKNPIYLETLKNMASLSLVEGVNHLFFPGGTRSRSGAIENQLKLGLLNSVIDSQRHCILNNIDQKIFVVPLTIGYHFVLEAESLIDQHLKDTGREKYTRNKKKKRTLKSLFKLFRSLRKNDSEIHMSLGHPIDVLGNKVSDTGESFDERGNAVKISDYFSSENVPNTDKQRESVYTKVLANKIVESFKIENIVLSSHLVAYAFYNGLLKLHPDKDIYELLKSPAKSYKLSMKEMLDSVVTIQNKILELNKTGQARISPVIELSADDCLTDGLKNIGIYHSKKVLYLSKGQLMTEDLRILYYYNNKMSHYNIFT